MARGNDMNITPNKIELIKKFKGKWSVKSIANSTQLTQRDVRVILDTLNLINKPS